MYAVIKTGGKQYKVQEGDTVRTEKLEGEVGSEIELEEVLMLVDGDQVEVGSPAIEGAKVAAEISAHGRADKIEIVKFLRRKHHRKQMGHRQAFTDLKVTKISMGA